MMTLQLIKKDFLIVKKCVLLMAALCLGFPVLMLWQEPEYAGLPAFVLVSFLSIFILLMQLSLKEGLNPRAAAMLCAAPYSKTMLVMARYCFLLLVFLGSCLLFWLETVVLPGLGPLRPSVLLTAFLALSLFLGVYLPLYYWLGFERAKLLLSLAIMLFPVLFPQFLKLSAVPGISLLFTGDEALLSLGILLAGILILTGSALCSIRIYRRRDLI